MSLDSWWFNKEGDKLVVTITWSDGIDITQISGTGTLSTKFIDSPNVKIVDIDSNDNVFSTNKNMIVNSITIRSTGGSNADFELGYGTTVDSITGWMKLWSGNVTDTTPLSNSRRIFLPKGNYLTLHRTGGTNNLFFDGDISISQEVTPDSNLNDDMEGNSP